MKRFIGYIPLDNSVRLVLPIDAEGTDTGAEIRARLSDWGRGVVVYHAANDDNSVQCTIMETYMTDAQLAAHQSDLEAMAQRAAAVLGSADLDINNRMGVPQPVSQPALLSTEEAATYLGVSVATIRKHVHVTKTLQGTKVGHTLLFTREELDRFNAHRRGTGRPKKD